MDARTQYAYLITSRGCPARCTFCNTPGFWGNRIRFRSVEHILAEMRRVREEYGLLYLSIRDDTFTANRRRVLELCEVRPGPMELDAEATKPYTFGDLLDIDAAATVANAVRRSPRLPIRFEPEDLEVHETAPPPPRATSMGLSSERAATWPSKIGCGATALTPCLAS